MTAPVCSYMCVAALYYIWDKSYNENSEGKLLYCNNPWYGGCGSYNWCNSCLLAKHCRDQTVSLHVTNFHDWRLLLLQLAGDVLYVMDILHQCSLTHFFVWGGEEIKTVQWYLSIFIYELNVVYKHDKLMRWCLETLIWYVAARRHEGRTFKERVGDERAANTSGGAAEAVGRPRPPHFSPAWTDHSQRGTCHNVAGRCMC